MARVSPADRGPAAEPKHAASGALAEAGESRDRYNVKAVESHWQKVWAESSLYQAQLASPQPKFYCLEQFPYPSGHLHMGHVRVYTLGDVMARFRRMNGLNVLHPMGWDAFGLPAENAAIKNGTPPAVSTADHIAFMKAQMQGLGLSFDWSREVNTSSPEYYRFTQALFLLFWERGLAYRKAGPVNWCPGCQTVLANEQVEDGSCWRCDSPVEKRDLTQWYFRITAYADRLLDDLAGLDWPSEIKVQQENWIGRSVGASIDFPLKDLPDQKITVFTTRPDTLYGVTYLVLAPEHPLVGRLTGDDERDAVERFVAEERRRSDIERTAEGTEKRGLFIGAHAVHPLTGEDLPIWIANYVLVDYGTGAVMGVPAHDQRDYVFATRYHLPIRTVIVPDAESPPEGAAFTGRGHLVNSGRFDAMDNEQAKTAIVDQLTAVGSGEQRVTYRMRDWLISRQRYWGAPIPMVHCASCGVVPVPLEDLPVLLPQDVTFTGKGASPLVGAEAWRNTTCPRCGGLGERETDTMDTFVDSSWYYYRYVSPDADVPFDVAQARYWLPVDEYVGGKEHAVLHLLYSRFFTKVLYDAGMASVSEPFRHLLAQGMVVYHGSKMSKSKGNTVSPETIVDRYGADATRLFMLFAAPPEKDLEWSDKGVEGSYRFLQRVYRLMRRVVDGETPAIGCAETTEQVERVKARTVAKVSEDLGERRAFNTAVSALMEYTNALYQHWEQFDAVSGRYHVETLLLLLAPFAPHLAEAAWQELGHERSIHLEAWPTYDPGLLEEPTVEIVLQVNGRVRAKTVVARDLSPEALSQLALDDARMQSYLTGQKVVKVVAIPGRLVNVVLA